MLYVVSFYFPTIAFLQTDDYQKTYSSLRSSDIPCVDFPKLFLAAARRGQRDVALLLSTRVPDLSVQDEWGETAFTMTARLVSVRLRLLGRTSYVHSTRKSVYFCHLHDNVFHDYFIYR